MMSGRQAVDTHTQEQCMADINNSCLYWPIFNMALWTANGIVAALQMPSDGHYMKVFLSYFVGIVYFMYPFIKKPMQ